MADHIFTQLEEINHRPEPFEFYTARELWNDEYTSEQMLAHHLNPDIDVSSRRERFINRSVAWIVSHFGVEQGTRIADFGCGPGLYTTPLAEHDATVVGIDFSDRSIGHAQQLADEQDLDISYINQNYLEFETEDRFDLILMIMCDYGALSPSQRSIMLGKFRKLLAPGGAILLDVYSMSAFRARQEARMYKLNLLDGFWSRDRYFGFLNTFKYQHAKVVLDKYTIVEPQRTRVFYNWLQYFSPESLRAEFEQAGFRHSELHGDVAGGPFDRDGPEFAFVARV